MPIFLTEKLSRLYYWLSKAYSQTLLILATLLESTNYHKCQFAKAFSDISTIAARLGTTLKMPMGKLVFVIGLSVCSAQAWAQPTGPQSHSLPWLTMLMELFGGLALFLYGMDMLASALKAIAGDRLKLVLAKLTQRPVVAAGTGAFVTAILQSSSITTVLVVGFVSANLMSLSQSIGIIMGANIGTTITAQLIAFKVTQFALPLITIAVGMKFFSNSEKLTKYSQILLGLGLLFFGMALMSQGMSPLKQSDSFNALLTQWQSPLIAVLYAAAFTALVQSSSATTGIVIVMATQGLLTLESGIALLLGANMGTCVTALLASIGKSREAVRVALVHVLFNLFGAIFWLMFLSYLVDWVLWISPESSHPLEEFKLAEEVPRQVANAHTLFNLANTAILLPFAGVIAKLCEWLIPSRRDYDDRGRKLKPRYLSNILLDTPSLALEATAREINRMGHRVSYMLKHFLTSLVENDHLLHDKICKMDDEVDALHRAIVSYLGELSKHTSSRDDTNKLHALMEAANTIEDIGDLIELNLQHLRQIKQKKHLVFSLPSQEVLKEIHTQVCDDFDVLLNVITEQDSQLAQSIVSHKKPMKDRVQEAHNHLIARLVAEAPHRTSTYRMEIDFIERLKHVHDNIRRIAKTMSKTYYQ